MALILLGSEHLRCFWTQEGISAMRHQNSVLHQILKFVPWAEFEGLVAKHQADKHVRRLTTKSQLVAMLYAQLAQAACRLAEIEAFAARRLQLVACSSLPRLAFRAVRRLSFASRVV
jgi:hypothetical protein